MTMNMQRTIGNSIRLRRTITDLGRVDSSLSGILSPGYAPDEVDRHIHTLFQQDYEEYLRPFPLTRGSIDHWIDLLRTFMPESHQRFDAPFRILDVGSGGGTTVFPLLELYPSAEIIASDLSLNLLRELHQWHSDHYPNSGRLSLLQLNAENTVFEDAQLDIVMGADVLHHLPDLGKVFEEVGRILKPRRRRPVLRGLRERPPTPLAGHAAVDRQERLAAAGAADEQRSGGNLPDLHG